MKFKQNFFCLQKQVLNLHSNDRRSCHIRYQPTVEEINKLYNYMSEEKVILQLKGAYTVLYDVEGTDMYGSMSVNNGYVKV